MAQVPPRLAPFVSSLVAYDVDLGGPGIHRGLPSTCLTLVLPLDDPLEVGWLGDPDSRTRGWSSVSGLHARPAAIHHRGHQRGVQLGLTVSGARALLGVPAAELAGELLELGDVAPDLGHLPERLAGAPWAEAAELVVRELTAALARRDAPGPRAELGRALARLTRGTPVHEVADEVGYSRRHLATLVRRECGIPPKQLQRIGRFESARALVGRKPLADVAARCGYADQAHLTREWRELTGCTPSTWLREEFPFVQDPAPETTAG